MAHLRRCLRRSSLAVVAAALLVALAGPVQAASATVQLQVTHKGFLTEYRLPRPLMGPLGIALDGSDGVWVSFDGAPDFSKAAPIPGLPLPPPAPNPGLIGRLDPARGTFEYIDAPAAIKPLLLEVGPDGAIWVSHAGFQDTLSEKGLARFDPASRTWKVFEMAEPFGSGGMAFDAAGNLWFTDLTTGKIGRLVPSTGKIQEFEVPYSPTTLGIATAPDGKRLWIAGGSVNGLLLYDPATKRAKEYPLPDKIWGPSDVLPDEGANGVWTTAHGGNEIVLVKADTGKIATQFRVTPKENTPGGHGLPYGLERDSRGHIWVAVHEGDRVARIVPGIDTLNEYPVEGKPTAWIQWLTIDERDNVWFAEFGNNTIGRITPDAPVFSVELDKTTLEVPNSGSVEGTMRISSVDGSVGELEMKAFLTPGGIQASFEPAKVRVEPGKPVEVRYTVRADVSATIHTYPFQMGGVGSGVIASRTLTLKVLPKGATPGSGSATGDAEEAVPAGTDAGSGAGGIAGLKSVTMGASVVFLALIASLLLRSSARRRGGSSPD